MSGRERTACNQARVHRGDPARDAVEANQARALDQGGVFRQPVRQVVPGNPDPTLGTQQLQSDPATGCGEQGKGSRVASHPRQGGGVAGRTGRQQQNPQQVDRQQRWTTPDGCERDEPEADPKLKESGQEAGQGRGKNRGPAVDGDEKRDQGHESKHPEGTRKARDPEQRARQRAEHQSFTAFRSRHQHRDQSNFCSGLYRLHRSREALFR